MQNHIHVCPLLIVMLYVLYATVGVVLAELLCTCWAVGLLPVPSIVSSLPADIDECQSGTSGCQQLCTNTVGSFFCRCRAGYSLNSDARTCRGDLENVEIVPYN